eukprot:COSAG01_NODE_4078_length_5377_cov_48.766578_3_plen_77_part_00
MPLRRFLPADRPAPEAIRPLASQLLFGDPLRHILCAEKRLIGCVCCVKVKEVAALHCMWCVQVLCLNKGHTQTETY